ncbi:MAG: lysylphosphatidylglycerol synthase transmembrane domain-containing protein [Candidatus Acidiferrales bacterium]
MINIFKVIVRKRSLLLRIIGYTVAISSLIWVLRDFHVVRAVHDMADADWRLVLVGMTLDVLSYLFQAIRWKLLLTPFGKVRTRRSVRSIFAGLFANLIFPLRPGEFLRSYLLSNSEGIGLGRVLGSVGVERFVDLVIATAGLGIVSLLVELPRRFDRAADILGVIILVLLIVVVALVLNIEFRLGRGKAQKTEEHHVPGRAMQALIVLHAMGTAPSFYPAVAVSLLIPFSQAMALWVLMHSYGLHLSILAAVVVLLVINLGVSLPNAPANVGSYQFFCVLGLSIFQVGKNRATGFSIFAFIALTLPFVFLGFAALLRSGLSLRSMREKVSTFPRQGSGRGPTKKG